MNKPAEKTLDKLRNGENVTIVAFGDSITEGYDSARSFVDFWEEALRKNYPSALLRMINSGISGDTTFGAVDRFRRDVAPHRPDLVTVQFGINDCYNTVYRSEFRENLQWIILRIQEETGAEIILVTSMLPRNEQDHESLMRYYDVIRFYATEYNLAIVELDTLWLRALRGERDFDSLVLPDGIHPSEAGHRLIAEEFMRLF
ncbi:MAG: GDSL-type esterase/lipase family protein [bacterium]